MQNPGRLSSCGRNAGVAAAKGDIIIFSDGHCHVPSRTLLRDAADLFARSGAGILCRPQPLDFPESTPFQRVVAAARASWLGHGRDSTIYSTEFEGWVDPSSAGAMYRRELFERFGGTDESFDACEDVEFNYRLHRAGIKAYISPKLTVYYEPRKSMTSLFRQMVRYGRGRVRLARKHHGSGSLSQLVPVLLLLLFVTWPVIFWTPLLWPWLWATAFYLGIVLAESLHVAMDIGLAKFPTLAITYMAIHFGLGTGMAMEWLHRSGSRREQVPAVISKQNGQRLGLQVRPGRSDRQEIGTT